jgi:hypothetical protein
MATHRVFDLTEDPRISHRSAPNQHAITSRLVKTGKRAFNRRHIATP